MWCIQSNWWAENLSERQYNYVLLKEGRAGRGNTPEDMVPHPANNKKSWLILVDSGDSFAQNLRYGCQGGSFVHREHGGYEGEVVRAQEGLGVQVQEGREDQVILGDPK
jgi:hypothetical protein